MIDAWQDYFEQEAKRAEERRGKEAPMRWGQDMGESGYFCLPCWRRGDETGYHPHSDPPCDPVPERPVF